MDLKTSNNPSIDWIIVFYHRHIYGSGSGFNEEKDFRKIYHPLFDKYKVDLAFQGHLHVYERTFPVTYNYETDKPGNKVDIVTIYDNETDTEWTYNRALENDPIVQDNATTNIYKNSKRDNFCNRWNRRSTWHGTWQIRRFFSQGILWKVWDTQSRIRKQ